jgi:DNA-directed RNA polymerase specialized sigma24 family protein
MERGTSSERFALDFHGGNSTSSQLALAARRGDRVTFLELIHTYDVMVMQVALALTTSEPAAQEIYCRVFRDAFISANTLEASSSVFIWLYRILARNCLEYCRHRSEAKLSPTDTKPVPTMARALLILPPMERMVFQLKQFEGLSIRTLSEIFDAPPEFITATLQNAISHLRIQLKFDSADENRVSRELTP